MMRHLDACRDIVRELAEQIRDVPAGVLA
jgi:hypothetical protein